MELTAIHFIAQICHERDCKKQGYAATPLWLCTRKDLQDKYIAEAERWVAYWIKEEMEAKESREKNIKYRGFGGNR